MGLSQHEQNKKPQKQGKAHNARPVELPPGVDWDEQERLAKSLKAAFIPPVPTYGNVKMTQYTPEIGATLCAHRRLGKSMRMIAAETKIKETTLRKWCSDYPEFSQAWNDMYHDYIVDHAEELVPRAEKLMEGLKLDGKKLSKVQEKRYMKAMEVLRDEVHWAASRRVPELYGTDDTGGELVLVQPTNIPERTVTQAKDQAVEYAKEVEDAHTSYMPDSAEPNGDGGRTGGEGDSSGAPDSDQPGGESVPPKRRYKVRPSRVLERSKRGTNAEFEAEMDRDQQGDGNPDSPGQQS